MIEIESLFNQLKAHRQILHKIAEIGRKEFKTSEYIRNYLEKLGIEYRSYLETGTVGIIKGKNPSKQLHLDQI